MRYYGDVTSALAREPITLTHNKACVSGHPGFVYRNDRPGTSELFLVVPGEVTLRYFPVTELGCAADKLTGFRLLHFLHGGLKHDTISTPSFSQVPLCLC